MNIQYWIIWIQYGIHLKILIAADVFYYKGQYWFELNIRKQYTEWHKIGMFFDPWSYRLF